MRAEWILVTMLAGGCGGGSPSSGELDARPDPGDDGGSGEPPIGEIVVLDGGGYGHLWSPPAVFGSLWGDAPPVWHTEVARDGACRVLAYQPGFCAACDGVCLAPDECRPWPDYLDAGTITVSGVAGDDVVLEPEFDQHYQTWGGLPDPLFAGGDEIAVDAGGGEVGPFSARVTAFARLTVPSLDEAGEAVLVDGDDIELTWPAPVAGARVHLYAHSGGALHGTPPEVILECDAEDTGSLVITASILEAVPVLGSGCAKMHDCAKLGIMRYARAAAATDRGEVVVTVGSGANYPLTAE
jgi:hypothetical protein